MVRIVVHKLGDVKEDFVERVFGLISNCYEHIGTHNVEIMDLFMFGRTSMMNAFIVEEKKKLGIETSDFESSVSAVHDAWHGVPRIMVACDSVLKMPELVMRGCLQHEVAHTILHGSLEYYSFSIPSALLKLMDRQTLSKQVASDLLYLATIAVKDFEATRFLCKHRFEEEQFAYCSLLLEPSEEDCIAWRLADQNKAARVLVLTAVLKTLFCAAPLLRTEKHATEMGKMIGNSIGYLPSALSAGLRKVLEAGSAFAEDTHANVSLLVRQIVDELFFEKDIRS